MDALRVSLGEQLFHMCYAEDGHVLRVVGGALHDFLNSFNVLLRQSRGGGGGCSGGGGGGGGDGGGDHPEPSVLCLDKDPGLLTVYYFNPQPATELFFPGVIRAAAGVLYHTSVDVVVVPPTDPVGAGKDCILQAGGPHQQQPQGPPLRYTVVVKDARSLSPSPQRATSAGTLPSSLFSTIFPFHLLLDQDLLLLQIGHGLRKRFTRKESLLRRATGFQEYFSIVSPQIRCSFQGILTMLNTQFVIRIRHTAAACSADGTGTVR